MTTRWLGLLAAAGLVVCRAPRDRANPADDDAALRRAMADSGGWPSYGRDYTGADLQTLLIQRGYKPFVT